MAAFIFHAFTLYENAFLRAVLYGNECERFSFMSSSSTQISFLEMLQQIDA